MTFVSVRLPEEIPWFRASRRAVVAAMLKEKRTGDVHHALYLCGALKTTPKRAGMTYAYQRPRHLGLSACGRRAVLLGKCGGWFVSGVCGKCRVMAGS